ncbi:MAG: lysylphosphatidylglycerol synthase transmembrane domain-containing protein [Bacteroidota bacterium]
MPSPKALLRYGVLLVAAGVLLWLSFRGIDLTSILQQFRDINYGWLAVSLGVSVLAFFSRAYRWNLLIEPLGFKPRLRETTDALMVGYLANLAVPRLGEVSRCGALARTSRVPFEQLIGTVIVERLIDVLSLGGCLLLTAWIGHERLGHFLWDLIVNPIRLRLATFSGAQQLTAGMVLVALLVMAIVWWKRRSGKQDKLSHILLGVGRGFRTVLSLQRKGDFLFHSIFIWFMYFLMSYTCFKALPASADLGWQAGLFVLVVGGMGMSAPVQGGIGAYHLLVSRGLLLYGLTTESGLAFATLMHTSQTLLVVVMGLLAMFSLSFLKPSAP